MIKRPDGFLMRCLALMALCFFATPSFAINSSHLMQGIGDMATILQDVSIGLGISLFLGAIFKLKRYGEGRTMMSQQHTLARPLAMMASGAALLCLPMVTRSLLLAFWGYSSPLAYPILLDPDATEMIRPVIALIRLVGLIGIVRGLFLMSRAGGEGVQPGMVGKAVLHMIGGVMCIQVLAVYDLMKALFNFV